ncbi:hypothetical protein ACLOJK_022971 [Asimina triloba]
MEWQRPCFDPCLQAPMPHRCRIKAASTVAHPDHENPSRAKAKDGCWLEIGQSFRLEGSSQRLVEAGHAYEAGYP